VAASWRDRASDRVELETKLIERRRRRTIREGTEAQPSGEDEAQGPASGWLGAEEWWPAAYQRSRCDGGSQGASLCQAALTDDKQVLYDLYDKVGCSGTCLPHRSAKAAGCHVPPRQTLLRLRGRGGSLADCVVRASSAPTRPLCASMPQPRNWVFQNEQVNSQSRR
jgi:hypothetical protein